MCSRSAARRKLSVSATATNWLQLAQFHRYLPCIEANMNGIGRINSHFLPFVKPIQRAAQETTDSCIEPAPPRRPHPRPEHRRARPLRQPDPGRVRRRRDQDRTARRRLDAPHRPEHRSRHGRDLPGRQPRQAQRRARPQASRRPRRAAQAGRHRRRADAQHPPAEARRDRPRPADAARAQPAAGLRRPARLRRRRPVRRHARLRRHHPGPVGLRRADGAPDRRARSTTRRSPPTRPPAWSRRTPSSPRCSGASAPARARYVEVPMLESMVSFNLVEHFYGHALRAAAGRAPAIRACSTRTASPSARRRLPVRDALHRRALEALLHRSAASRTLAADPRFANIAERTQNIEALYDDRRPHHRDAHARRNGSTCSRGSRSPRRA